MRQIRPYLTKEKRVRGVVVTYVDITELLLAEEQLRAAHSRPDGFQRRNHRFRLFGADYCLEPRRRTDVRIHGSGGARNERFATHPGRTQKRRGGVPGASTQRTSSPSARKHSCLQKRHATRSMGDDDNACDNRGLSQSSLANTEHDLTEGKAVARVQHLATHDQLTGLPNGLLLEELAAQALARAARSDTKVAVLFVDIDQFKTINDTRGHQVGDLALQSIAKRLKSCVRGQDTVVRHGGDEFIILLTGISTAADAGVAAEHILSSVARPYTIQTQEMHSTVSIGISLYPDDASHLEHLVRNADTAMYRAKARGHGTFAYFTPDMGAGVWDRRSFEYGLFRAVEQREFLLHYQPQVDLELGRIIGAEALLRWQHPQLGLVKPQNFIPLTEETGLIVPLGEWVMLTACSQAKSWQASGLPAIQMAINLSAVQIAQLDFSASVAKALAESGLESKYLELEITESALMGNIEPSIMRLRQLRQMGIRLALDDFGTGYSSLSYLRQLPINRLKMDVSFVHALTTDPGGDILVKAILSIARSLKVQVMAEGVETLEQLTLLQAEGCDEIQGYYFSQPVVPEEFEKMLREQKTLSD